MWPLPRPEINAADTLLASTTGMTRTVRKALILGATEDILKAESEYAEAAENGDLLELTHLKDTEIVSLLRDALVHAYDDGLVQSTAGRILYDRLRAAAPDARCPMCGHGDVDTIDHYLPKRMFPCLALVPLNLIPCCSKCNHGKGDKLPKSSTEQPLHPYFDDLGNDRWLFARVIESEPARTEFFIRHPAAWSADLAARADFHFRDFKIAGRYANQAARRMNGMRRRLVDLLEVDGAQGVRDHLSAEAESQALAHPNTWETALFFGLAESLWYTAGGMRHTGA